MIIPCKQCKKEFNRFPYQTTKQYCSKGCFDNWQREEAIKNRLSKICLNCKIPYTVPKRMSGQKYCSHKCLGVASRTRINKNCKICDKTFFTHKSRIKDSRGKYCGFKCYYKSLEGRTPWNKGTKGVVKAWNKGLIFPERSEEKSPEWKGDSVGYQGLHAWVRRQLGRPSTCEHCQKSDLQGKQIHWANKSQEYKREATDWIRLCASCHKLYDLGFKVP